MHLCLSDPRPPQMPTLAWVAAMREIQEWARKILEATEDFDLD